MSKYAVELVDNDVRFGRILKIVRNGETIQEEYDCGEPEDNSFYRDWSWVEGALLGAYNFGLEDGKNV